MAQKTQILLVCDLHDDDTEGTETIAFGLDGTSYEIDLNDGNATALRESLAGYLGHARKVAGGGSRRTSSRRSGGSSANGAGNTRAVREWAKENGHEVSERGRISASVQEAYDAAH
jgi:hypothetical protein